MSLKDKLDPRAERSQAWLQNALLDLIKEKPYKQISISEITDRAGLARPTFYLHYESKNDLLLNYLDQLFEQFYKDIDFDILETEISASAAAKIFQQVQDHPEIFHVVLTAGSDQLLLKRFQSYILKVFNRFTTKNNLKTETTPYLNYVADYLAGAILAMIMDWMEMGQPHSPEIMGEIFYQLTHQGFTNILVKGALNRIQ